MLRINMYFRLAIHLPRRGIAALFCLRRYSIFGIGVDRKHLLKWLLSKEKATLHALQKVHVYSENALRQQPASGGVRPARSHRQVTTYRYLRYFRFQRTPSFESSSTMPFSASSLRIWSARLKLRCLLA